MREKYGGVLGFVPFEDSEIIEVTSFNFILCNTRNKGVDIKGKRTQFLTRCSTLWTFLKFPVNIEMGG